MHHSGVLPMSPYGCNLFTYSIHLKGRGAKLGMISPSSESLSLEGESGKLKKLAQKGNGNYEIITEENSDEKLVKEAKAILLKGK